MFLLAEESELNLSTAACDSQNERNDGTGNADTLSIHELEQLDTLSRQASRAPAARAGAVGGTAIGSSSGATTAGSSSAKQGVADKLASLMGVSPEGLIAGFWVVFGTGILSMLALSIRSARMSERAFDVIGAAETLINREPRVLGTVGRIYAAGAYQVRRFVFQLRAPRSHFAHS